MEVVLSVIALAVLAATMVGLRISRNARYHKAEMQRCDLARAQIELTARTLEARRQMLAIAMNAAEENHRKSSDCWTYEGR